ncbi:hypothetical protein CMI37_01245 [Candidatus Pacearchaeota archaeon]|jgi:co-chaperonin GroES (HSP10)|nr:hypothetical protein [Candidatus Pacearchaeota archaeon]|tara:strand:- start:5483 stop:5752 length:270 start_codon:yes stop_codon:yes gene_type:complete
MLTPVNRYILIEVPPKPDISQSLIVLPEDYKPEEQKFVEVIGVKGALDARFDIATGSRLVVDRAMIEEITVGTTIYNVILDNYVVGMVE